jgi:hypothetical protein
MLIIHKKTFLYNRRKKQVEPWVFLKIFFEIIAINKILCKICDKNLATGAETSIKQAINCKGYPIDTGLICKLMKLK